MVVTIAILTAGGSVRFEVLPDRETADRRLVGWGKLGCLSSCILEKGADPFVRADWARREVAAAKRRGVLS